MPGPIAGGFAILVTRLFTFAWSKIQPGVTATASRAGGRGGIGLALTAGAIATDLLNIDELRREAVKIAPNSDPEALEEAARQILRMVGADGSDVMFPTNGPPNYFVMNMRNGQQWFTTQYRSSKSVRAAARRGAARARPRFSNRIPIQGR